ncbi:MAG TPA: glycosyltransferase [Chitinophagaceae bacterium]|nr:glycosyltransferase [Chitinophagaceae bacterium]
MTFLYWPDALFYAFCLITFIQLFYYLFYFSRVAFYKSRKKESSIQHPVSVVICARDEAANLAKNLPPVLQQQYKSSHEIIVVNDNSYDDSKYVLEYLAKPFKQLRTVELVQEAKFIPGKKFPLSMGIKEAKYEIVLLTDADCYPSSPNWIEKMQNSYDDDIEIVLGYGAYEKKRGLLNKLIRLETFQTALQFLSMALAGNPYMGVGRNLSYKRGLFIRNKGFSSHNHIAGGDDDLFVNANANKHNTAVVLDKEAFTYSEPKKSWSEWIRQKSRHYSTSKYYKGKHKFLLGLYAFSQFSFLPLFITSLIFYNWYWVLSVFAFRFLMQMVVYSKSMWRLHEKDLLWLLPFFDLWQVAYYIIFLPAVWKKASNNWK